METYQDKDYCQLEQVFDINNKSLERYHAIRFDIPSGKYEATVIGLKKENMEDQYGFLIILNVIDNFVVNADASETAFIEMFPPV